MLQDSCQFNATTGSIEVVDRKIADEIHVSSMRSSMRLRGALKL
ncbi:hypothetical protein [Lactococcus lactis]|nr:hypothetical protein [Lactococcus lactis]